MLREIIKFIKKNIINVLLIYAYDSLIFPLNVIIPINIFTIFFIYIFGFFGMFGLILLSFLI